MYVIKAKERNTPQLFITILHYDVLLRYFTVVLHYDITIRYPITVNEKVKEEKNRPIIFYSRSDSSQLLSRPTGNEWIEGKKKI